MVQDRQPHGQFLGITQFSCQDAVISIGMGGDDGG